MKSAIKRGLVPLLSLHLILSALAGRSQASPRLGRARLGSPLAATCTGESERTARTTMGARTLRGTAGTSTIATRQKDGRTDSWLTTMSCSRLRHADTPI